MENKIQQANLLSEIKAALSDTFVAELTQTEEGVTIKFTNGQAFLLQLKEL